MPTKFCRRRFCAASLLVALLVSGNSPAAQTSRTSGSSSSPITVVIDAGHGGHDRGGIPGQRIAEKDMTLDVAQRLSNVLAASGYRVVMTRESDVFVSMKEECASSSPFKPMRE